MGSFSRGKRCSFGLPCGLLAIRRRLVNRLDCIAQFDRLIVGRYPSNISPVPHGTPPLRGHRMRSASRTLPSGPRPNAFQREVLNGLSHVTCATSPLEDFTIIWTSSSRRFAVLTRLGESSVESSPAGARRRSLGLEQLRRECRKIIAPVQPRVSAFALEKDRLEPVLLQELHRAPRRRDQTVVFAGAAAGIVLALAGTRLVTHLIYGSAAGDWMFYALAAALVSMVGLLASLTPARRAAAVEPLVALRCD